MSKFNMGYTNIIWMWLLPFSKQDVTKISTSNEFIEEGRQEKRVIPGLVALHIFSRSAVSQQTNRASN